MGEPVKIFVSYASEEKEAVAEIKRVLGGGHLLHVWLDREQMVGGSNIRREIEAALRQADVFLAVYGRHPRDGFAAEELDVALAMKPPSRPKFVAVVVKGHKADDDGNPDTSAWSIWLGPFLRVDFRAGAADDEACDDLLRAVVPQDALRGESPYPGLSAYGPQDAENFLGRGPQIAEVIARLHTQRFVVIVGASGSGKTSLARAGVGPRLRGMTDPPGPWEVVDLPLPRRDGSSGEDAWPSVPEGRRLVLVVDGLESLLDRSSGVAEAFAQRLAQAATDAAGTRVLATLRADFLGEASEIRTLRGLIENAEFWLAKPETDELRKAVRQPALRHGVDFEPSLVERLLRDYGRRPGSLPLLNQTLRSLWRRSAGPTLTLLAYEGGMGGLEGALVALADRAWADIAREDQAVARQILVRLAVPQGPLGSLVGRSQAEDRLVQAPADQVHRIVDTFVAARLLWADGVGAGRLVSVTHDTLFEAWPRLAGWLQEDVADAAAESHLGQAAADWDTNERNGSFLYQGAKLIRAVDFAERVTIGPLERAFLDASRAAERAAKRRETRLRRRGGVMGGLVVVALLIVGLVTWSWRTTEDARRESQVLRLAAEADRHLASEPDASLLLAAEAVDRGPSVESLGTLIDVLGRAPLPARQARTGRDAPRSIASASDDASVYVGTEDGGVQRLLPDGAEAEQVADFSTLPIVAVAELDGGDVLALDDAGVLHRSTGDGLSIEVATFSSPPRSFAVDAATGDAIAVVDRDVIALDAQGTETARWPLHQEDSRYPGHRPLVAASPDGHTVVVTDARRVLIGDRRQPAVELTNLTDLPDAATAIAVDTLQNRMAVGDETGTVTLLRLSAPELLGEFRFRMPDGSVSSLAFSPDGASLAGGNDAGRIVTWDIAQAAVALGPFELRPAAGWARRSGPSATSFVGDLVFVADDTLVGLDREAVVWWLLEPGAGLATRRWDVGAPDAPPATTADGAPVIVDSDGGVWVGEDERPALGSDVTAVATVGERVVTGSADGEVRIDGTALAGIDGEVLFLARTGDGHLVAAGSHEVLVVPLPESGGSPSELELKAGDDVLAVAAGHQDGRLAVAVNGPDGPAVHTWRRVGDAYQTGPSYAVHTGRIDALAFDERGWLFSGSDDRTIRVVDTEAQGSEPLQALTGHGDGIVSLALDGDRLWASTQNGEVHAWQRRDERYVRLGGVARIDPSWVQLAVAAPGELVVATSTKVSTWAVGPDQLVERACSLAGRTFTREELDALRLDQATGCP